MVKDSLLWLDDSRDIINNPEWLIFSPINPKTIIWVKSYEEFVSWIENNGLPEAVSFDHDLHTEHIEDFYKQKKKTPTGLIYPDYKSYKEKTGLECVKWLVAYCKKNRLRFPKWNIHSSNIVGRENIKKEIELYAKECNTR